MNYALEYTAKKRTADAAVRLIEPEQDLFCPLSVGEPPALLNALPGHTGLRGNRLFQMLSLKPLIDVPPERLQLVSMFLGGYDRQAFQEQKIDLLPNHFSDLPKLLREVTKKRVVLARVAPMDAEGYFSLGTNSDYITTLLDDASLILLEVNEHMPRTFGSNRVHISQVGALVENHVPLPELPEPKITENDVQIGRTIAELIEDGDTLQIGVGAIPNAVMDFLKGHRELGIFSEMLPDKVVDLCEAGVITNSRKPLYPGQSTATFALGSQRLYRFLHENQDVLFLPVNVSNDVRTIAQMDHIVSINAAVEVDFLGQCNSEMIGGRYYSSTGGQSDFAKGVRLAEHGRGIICLHSTTKNGEISKIVPGLPAGTPVSTHKNDVDRVVTEYGVAELKGKTIRERTQALIRIAHPKFREELTFQARKMGYLI